MKKYILIIACGLFTITGYTQSNFRVLASSGNNTLLGKSENLLVGTRLLNNQQVKVSHRSYLSLVHNSGGTVQISKAGTYNISTLEKKLAEKRKSVASRYATYIISELTRKGQENINNNRYKYMNVTGSVNRATTKGISVYLPQVSNFYQPKITITWQTLIGAKDYNIKLTDTFEEESYYTKTLKDTSLVIDFGQGKLKDVKEFYVIIEANKADGSEKVESDKYGLFRLDSEDAPAFDKAYAAFKKTNTGEANATTKLSEAFFFESKEFYTDALRCYEEAVKMSGKAEAYVTALNQFLVRSNMGQTPEEDKKD